MTVDSTQLALRERRDRAIQHAGLSALVPGLGQVAQRRLGAALTLRAQRGHRSMRRIFFLSFPLLSLAAECGRNQTQRPSQPPTQGTAAAATKPSLPVAAPRGAPSDSLVINVDRPTVVAYFAVPQAEMDSQPGGEEVLSDFQFYLPGARDSLAKLGVAFRAQTGDTVVYRDGGVIKRWSPPRDSADVGYVFFTPRSAPRAKYGVDTDTGLQEWVKGLLEPARRGGS